MWLDSPARGGDNRCHMSRLGAGRWHRTSRRTAGGALRCRRLFAAALILGTPLWAPHASGQEAQGTLGIRTVIESSQTTGAARVVISSEDHLLPELTVDQAPGAPPSVWRLPPGTYRVRADLPGHQAVEGSVVAHAGARRDLLVTFTPIGAGASTLSTVEASSAATQVTFAADRLELLPTARTVWSLLDTAHPFLITDRIDNGGLGGGVPARVGGYGSPWAQTTFRLGAVDVTEPVSGGTPLFYPSLDGLAEVVVSSAGVGVESAGPGPTVTMVPRRAADAWRGAVRGSLTPNGLQGALNGAADPIARFDNWADGNVALGGPVGRSRGGSLFVSALGTRARWMERGATTVLASTVRSVVAHAVTTSDPRGEASATVAVTDDTRPYRARARFASPDLQEGTRSVSAGLGWRRAPAAGTWSFGGTYQGWSVDPDALATAGGGAIERLQDGPPNGLFEAGPESGRRVEINGAFAARPRGTWGRGHELSAGATLTHARSDWEGGAQPAFAEFVDGAPARVWDVHGGSEPSRRSASSVGLFVSDRIALTPALTVRAGARMEFDRGAARGSAEKVRWATPLPRVWASWRPRADGQLVLTSGYGWYGHRLRLDTLAVGDPAGAAGVMYRWDDRNGDRRHTTSELTAVAAVGSCCAGTSPGRIDQDLQRPTTREFVIGFEHGIGAWRWGINGVDRRESDVLVLANVGLTAADYTTRLVGDPGIDLNAPVTAPTLAIRSRNASSFLRDSYLLANDDGPAGRYQGAEIFVRRQAGRWRMDFGGTTYRAEVAGANRGYRSDENDQGTLGEVQLDPNATLNARGRLFFDRAYVIKLSGDYRAPGALDIGVASRYQDGQPFARVVVAEGLGQGTDIVPAYPRGGQRFTYTLTLDARVQKGFALGTRRLDVIVEAFNLLDLAKEVEEYIVTGPRFRTVTAVQPPREVRFGLRLAF